MQIVLNSIYNIRLKLLTKNFPPFYMTPPTSGEIDSADFKISDFTVSANSNLYCIFKKTLIR
jgi:hypothetical protein